MADKRIIITGAAGPAGVNFIRSLRASSEPMYLIGTDINEHHLAWIRDPAHPENAVDEAHLMPRASDPSYIDRLNDLIEKTRANFVYPQSDTEVGFISEHRERINAPVFLPAKETVSTCQDKFLSAKAWEAAGLPIVRTLYVTSDERDLAAAENAFGYPYWMRASTGAGGRGSALVENAENARSWIRFWESKGVPWKFIAQEYLPGAIIAFQSVWKDGKPVTSQARERVEYIYPYLAPSGITGTPVVARTIVRKDVNDMATRAILAIDPKASGVFCVDLRENKNGVPIPTEINPGRFFTTSYFFTAAGVNMPHCYVSLAYGDPMPEMRPYDAVGADIYWCRHIDCPGVLRTTT